MSLTTVLQSNGGRLSLPVSAAKPKKKKKSAPKTDIVTHGTMPSTSQFSSSNAEPTTPPFSIRNERETPKQRQHDEYSDNSKQTRGHDVSTLGYSSRPAASEKKPAISSIMIQKATPVTGFEGDQKDSVVSEFVQENHPDSLGSY